MSYTVMQLIANAYYESGIVARSFETVTGEQFNDGLIYLNEVIGKKRLDDGALPYYKNYEFNFVIGQEIYFIPDLIEVDTLVFYLDSVRYSMANQKRRVYFGTPRAENIETLPTNWHIERTLGGSNLYVYFLPNAAYPGVLWGLFALNSVSLNQDLSTMFDTYYITYLRYDLVRSLCAGYNFEVPTKIMMEYAEYDKLIRKRSGVLDMQNSVISTLAGQSSLNCGQVNLGKGWTTSSR